MSLVSLQNVSHYFRGQTVPAMNSVTVTVEPGELVALVGESGCGKSTLGRVACGMITPTDGTVTFDGRPVAGMSRRESTNFRRRVQMVHQDPYASLNPSLPLRTTLGYGPRYHKLVDRTDLDSYLVDLLARVGLDEGREFLDRYPHQLSGGQRQRISIARAVSMDPLLIVADEAVSMLDVSMRVSLLDLLLRFRDDKHVGYLFVSHDLGVVRYFAGQGRMIVMFYGVIVEEGATETVITTPRHPYTAQLLDSIPVPDPRLARQRDRTELLQTASAAPLTGGCVFRHRCPLARDRCTHEKPPLESVGDAHRSACWYPNEVAARTAMD